MAEELKAKGNAAFAAGKHDEAITHFTEAIAVDSGNHVLYSNRSAAFAAKGDFSKALDDANKCVSISPQWAKGYNRKGAALSFMKKHAEAMEAYKAGLAIEPTNEQLKAGLKEVEAAQARNASFKNPMDQLFGPALIGKLATNPATRAYLDQPDFMAMLGDLQRDGIGAFQKHSGDPRMQQVLQIALSGMGGMGGAGGPMGGDMPPMGDDDEDMPDMEELSQPKPKAAAPAPAPAPKQEKKKEEPSTSGKTPEQKEALAEKEKGNALYKNKDLDGALGHYNKAIQLDPNEMLYLNNRAAVMLEKGDIEACIADCKKAIEVGRAHRADYANIAKAYARMGNAHYKVKNLADAIKCYQDSLMENRTPDVLKKLSETELEKRKADALAYRDPVLAEAAKEEGNKFFKDNKFPDAIKKYEEAIKRNPEVAAYYANRAAAYQKMGEFPLSVTDCDKALELEPAFYKAFLRKGNAQLVMKEFHKAQETFEKGLALNPGNEDLKDGLRRVKTAIYSGNDSSGGDDDERAKRAMMDPDIQNILSDPIIKMVLQDMQQDPKAAMKHMANAEIATKINKLIAAGIIKTR